MRKDGFIMVMLAGLVLCSCGGTSSGGDAMVYKTMTVGRSSQTLLSEYSARLAGQQAVEVRPQVSGTITQICIGEGVKVRKGQVLFIIDQVPYKAALGEALANVSSAEAALANAKLTLESTEMLHKNKVVSDFELSTARNNCASAEAALKQAQAQEVTARNNLSYTEVKSPLDGIAGMIPYRVGALVSSSIDDPLVTVADDSVIQAYFSMTEAQMIDLMQDYGSLERFLDQAPEVELRMSNYKIYPEKGRVKAVSGIVSSGTNAVSLRADFPNEGNILRDGGSGSVIFPTEMKDCIVIPQTATYELQDRTYVFKVVDGKAQSVRVQVYRLNDGHEYIVEDGLQVGDVIIAEGAGLVREGTEIKAVAE